MVVTAQYRVTSLAAGRKRRTRDLLILHLSFLKNEAFPRIPSQCVLTAHQPEAGPDLSPCQFWATGRLSLPERGLVRKRCDCRASSVSLLAAATSSSIPKVAVELDDVPAAASLASEAHMRLFTLTVARLLKAASCYMTVTCYSTTASQG